MKYQYNIILLHSDYHLYGNIIYIIYERAVLENYLEFSFLSFSIAPAHKKKVICIIL